MSCDTRWIWLAGLTSSLVACSVKSLPALGRTCAGDQPCAEGTRCDPATLTCQRPVDGAPPVDGPSFIDAALDLARDADDAARDLTVDAAPLAPLSCDGPAEVGAAEVPLGMPALRTDGLELVAVSAKTHYSTRRAGPDQPFGDWAVATALAATDGQDPFFFDDLAGDEWLIIAPAVPQGDLRALQLCPLPLAECSEITVLDEGTGRKVTYDMDGPSVIKIEGRLLMALNIQPGDSTTADVHLAWPQTPGNLTTWVAKPADAANRVGFKDDDPALSPDGLVLIFSSPDEGGDYDLWVAQRADRTSLFSTARPLDDLNSDAGDGGQAIYALPNGDLEVFFNSKRGVSGENRVFRALCRPGTGSAHSTP